MGSIPIRFTRAFRLSMPHTALRPPRDGGQRKTGALDTLSTEINFCDKNWAGVWMRAMFSVMCGILRQPMAAGKDRQHAVQGLGAGLLYPFLPVQLRHAAPMLRGHRAKAWSRGGMKRGSIPQARGFDSQTRAVQNGRPTLNRRMGFRKS